MNSIKRYEPDQPQGSHDRGKVSNLEALALVGAVLLWLLHLIWTLVDFGSLLEQQGYLPEAIRKQETEFSQLLESINGGAASARYRALG